MAEFTEYYTDSEYHSDEEDYTDIVYEPDEPSKTRYTIALCELYNDNIHGTIDSYNNINNKIQGHYLVNCRYKHLHMDWIMETAEFVQLEYQYLHNKNHNLFPNYSQIIVNENYIKPEIVECIYIEDHCIAIIKTFWIKIIQRTWRNILKRREEAFKYKKTLTAIRYKEMTGKWPTNCYASGGLIGMLNRV
jgi:hypothetical protein